MGSGEKNPYPLSAPRRRILSIVALLCLCALSRFSPAGAEENPHPIGKQVRNINDSVILQLKWRHQFQFAGYYAALEKGYYRDNRLNVEIREAKPGTDVVKEVTAGPAQFGVWGSMLAINRIAGEPVVVLACIFQHSPSILMTLKESSLASPPDLVGKRISVGVDSRGDILAMLLDEGLRLDQFQFVEPGYRIDDLIEGKKDAISGYSTNEPFLFRQRGIPIHVIHPISYGVDFYGDCLFTSEDQVNNHPARTQRFLDASLLGWEYAMEHTDEMVELILIKYAPHKNPDQLRFEAEAMRKLILPDLMQIGHINPGRWENIANTYIQVGMSDGEGSLKGIFYNPVMETASENMRKMTIGLIIAFLAFLTGCAYLLLFNRRLRAAVESRTLELSTLNRRLLAKTREQQQAEETLREAQEHLHKAFDTPHVGMVISRKSDGCYIEVNPGFERITGYAREEIIGKTSREMGLFSANQRQALIDDIDKKGTLQNRELLFRDKSGENRIILFSIGPVRIKAEPCLLGTLVDITDRKRMEEELVRAKGDAESANEAKSQFLANVSHEVRTPLSGIIGATDMLLQSDIDDPARNILGMMKDSSVSLLSLINDILDFSKVEAGKLDLELVQFDLRYMVRKIVSSFETAIDNRGLALDIGLHPDVPEEVIGDPERLGQILRNLIGNAVKFTESGHIHIGIRPATQEGPPSTILFAVKDTGIGIPEGEIPKLFRRFTQIDASYAKKYSGTGLGLAISKKLVERMGGSIWAESRKGNGAAIYFSIPFSEATLSERLSGAPNPDSRAMAEGPRPRKVLLAEDTPLNQAFLVHELEKEDFEVTTANNGVEVLRILERDSFDLVLMDIQMPEMDGLAATRHIREGAVKGVPPDLPVIALTAYALKGDREKLLASGMNGYCPKPVDMENLMEEIYRVFSRGKPSLPPETKNPAPKTVPFEEEIAVYIQSGRSDEAFVIRMFHGFMEEIPQKLDQLETALSEGDATAASQIAHSLCGLVGIMGLRSQIEDLRSLERTLRRGNLTDGASRFEGVKVPLRRIVAHIRNLPLMESPEASRIQKAD